MLKPTQALKNQKGMATFELVPLFVIFAIFVTYTYGFFGAIHSGILNSISARNYAFETFRHRPNLTYFRGNKYGPDYDGVYYQGAEVRFHAMTHINENQGTFTSPTHRISFGQDQSKIVNNAKSRESYHNEEIIESIQPGTRFSRGDGVNPIWLQIQYGICINASCGRGE